MKSPFPGMDPYLESRWSDVHATLIGFVKEALQPLLPKDLRARSEEQVLLESVEGELEKTYRSDVAVVKSPHGEQGAVVVIEDAAVAAPWVVRRDAGPGVDRFVQIVDIANGNRVVTAVEILRPWNKGSGRSNKEYLKKLDDYERGAVSVVEIDLLRSPARSRLQVAEEDLPPEKRSPYVVCVRRGWDPLLWEVYPISLRQRLPRIPIPLRRGERDVALEFQPLIERVYVAGGHDDIDYRRSPTPRLDEPDETWADQLLKQAGKR